MVSENDIESTSIFANATKFYLPGDYEPSDYLESSMGSPSPHATKTVFTTGPPSHSSSVDVVREALSHTSKELIKLE